MDTPVVSWDPAGLSSEIIQVFGSLAIDKRRLPESQLVRRGIPGYVAEWVLDSVAPGVGGLTEDDARRVQDWAAQRIPGPDDQNLIKFRLQKGEAVKILTPVQVEIIERRNKLTRVARLSLLGINEAQISDDLIDRNQDLLRQGLWGVTELINTNEGPAIVSFRPMQASINLDLYKEARRGFTIAEWQALILLSMGYNPEAFDDEERSLLLCRLLPLVQKNMHLIELAPKGTGKSYVYENISPRVRLVSGGNVSPAVLFVNNASGQPGILARYSVVVLDEVQTLKFERPEEIVGGLKGYLANGRLTRGGLHEMSSDCGLVLLANISLDEHQRPVTDPIVKELPYFLRETAFLDRIRGIIPGWKIRKLSGNSFATSAGLKSDFFGETLIALRHDLAADQVCARRLRLKGERAYRRNEESVRAIASGLVKILFPNGEFTDRQFYHYCVQPAVRLRQLVWDQLYSLDSEYRQFEEHLEPEIT